MFFGFAGSVLIGFLLTASKNWVKVRGIHGVSLMILVGLWVFERVFVYYASDFGLILKHLGLSLFFAASGLYVIGTLLKHRRNDSFNDNYFFVILLGLILVAKNLLISESYYQHGINMTVGLFRLAFVVIFSLQSAILSEISVSKSILLTSNALKTLVVHLGAQARTSFTAVSKNDRFIET